MLMFAIFSPLRFAVFRYIRHDAALRRQLSPFSFAMREAQEYNTEYVHNDIDTT